MNVIKHISPPRFLLTLAALGTLFLSAGTASAASTCSAKGVTIDMVGMDTDESTQTRQIYFSVQGSYSGTCPSYTSFKFVVDGGSTGLVQEADLDRFLRILPAAKLSGKTVRIDLEDSTKRYTAYRAYLE